MNVKIYVSTITETTDDGTFIFSQHLSADQEHAELACLDEFNNAWRERCQDNETEDFEEVDTNWFPNDRMTGTYKYNIETREFEVQL